MYRRMVCCLLFCVSAAFCANGQNAVDLDSNFLQHVRFLASDEMEGREPCTKGELESAEYIAKHFKIVGLRGVKQKKKFFQPFRFVYQDSIEKCARNVLGYLDLKKEKTVIIAAHYDHIGWGIFKSKEIFKQLKIHNGADDNASGVALMLELARWTKENKKKLQHNFLFIAYSGHELGLFGSKHFVNSDVYNKFNIAYVFNFDMVGRLDQRYPILNVGGTSIKSKERIFFTSRDGSPIHFSFGDNQLKTSDVTPFYEQGKKCFSFTTGIHTDYHKSTDDYDSINYDGMVLIFSLIADFLFLLQK